MNIWELPREHYNYESPITKIYGDIRNEIIRQDEENCTYAIQQAIGYKVDKDELIKALQYDRDQYDKGYKDGVKETFIAELEKIKSLTQVMKENSKFYDNQPFDLFLSLLDSRIADLKGNKCDNDHDCEYCDWVECPEMKGD